MLSRALERGWRVAGNSLQQKLLTITKTKYSFDLFLLSKKRNGDPSYWLQALSILVCDNHDALRFNSGEMLSIES
ncbi:hypothetical protein TCE0_034f10841 [Talaromyces pinophilus]|uniref:Uncharacterized protein n=1 Tax=Talaromyces pinophilus TaxID=128442 RepID=A0A6V8HD32_TALPI|nr:hypothetical protein DPV78_002485 [Talaromyces pinophilus]GAM39357.1 hypothetical protein TCE0_034f10841 [Talaromyces pinophilus]